jgi:hypothetical protein
MQVKVHRRRIADASAIASATQEQVHLRCKCKSICDARAFASAMQVQVASATQEQLRLRCKCKCIADASASASQMQEQLRLRCNHLLDGACAYVIMGHSRNVTVGVDEPTLRGACAYVGVDGPTVERCACVCHNGALVRLRPLFVSLL